MMLFYIYLLLVSVFLLTIEITCFSFTVANEDSCKISASRLPPLWYANRKQTVTIHNACKGSSAIEAAKKQTIPSLFNVVKHPVVYFC